MVQGRIGVGPGSGPRQHANCRISKKRHIAARIGPMRSKKLKPKKGQSIQKSVENVKIIDCITRYSIKCVDIYILYQFKFYTVY